MDIITIDGMTENDFRHSIEDMLRLDQVDEAIARLRELLAASGAAGTVLPARFQDVTAQDLEIGGWQRLDDRLLDHDRPNFPITAIGVTLADATTLGGPGPSGGKLAPFIKTFYFSDEAYPFKEATRDDLLDGYSRDGFELQGDYRATDATLSIKGIDDLYGAIIELEARLFETPEPDPDEIRAGAIGSCLLAALIHQALRDTIRAKGLPRTLCVFAACDGVYPFFDAPVAGVDECALAATAAATIDEELETISADSLDDNEGIAEEPKGEASLLSLTMRREGKTPVMVLDAQDAEDGFRETEMAAAQQMFADDAADRALPRHSFAFSEAAEAYLPEACPTDAHLSEAHPSEDRPMSDQSETTERFAAAPVLASDTHAVPAEAVAESVESPAREEATAPQPLSPWPEAAAADHALGVTEASGVDVPEAPCDPAEDAVAQPSRHSLRATINLAPPVRRSAIGAWWAALVARVRLIFAR